jgi:hypothetical protein
MWSGPVVDSNGFSWQRFALVWSAFIVVFQRVRLKLPLHTADLSGAGAGDRRPVGGAARAHADLVDLPLVVATGTCMLAIGFGFDAIAPLRR